MESMGIPVISIPLKFAFCKFVQYRYNRLYTQFQPGDRVEWASTVKAMANKRFKKGILVACSKDRLWVRSRNGKANLSMLKMGIIPYFVNYDSYSRLRAKVDENKKEEFKPKWKV